MVIFVAGVIGTLSLRGAVTSTQYQYFNVSFAKITRLTHYSVDT